MDVSIVIPYYERPEELMNLLNTLDSLDREGIEIETIVVADASPIPNEQALLNQHASLGLQFLHNNQNMGPGFSRNRGVQHADGRYLWFIDSDIEIPNPNILKNLITELNASPKRLAVGGTWESEAGIPLATRAKRLPSFYVVNEKVPISKDYADELDRLTSGNFFMERANFIASGGYDSALRTNEDEEFCMRLQKVLDGHFFQNERTLACHTLSEKGRDTGFLACHDPVRYFKVKYLTRLNLMKRYASWRLLLLPFLEVISVLLYVKDTRAGRLHSGRIKLSSDSRSSHLTFTLISALNVGSFFLSFALFFLPSPFQARREPPVSSHPPIEPILEEELQPCPL